jgi:Domain of unknown function (DUF4375)
MDIDAPYWKVIEPIWEEVDIYSGAEIFTKSLSAVRREVALLYAAHWCQSEVCNGGLGQFFGNSTGVLAPEAVEGFRAIGQPLIADLVVQAMLLLGQPYERERERRNELLDLLPDDVYDRIARPFGDLNEKFFELIRSESGGFEAAANQYARGIVA